jgi:hypothetical protein
MNTHICSTRCFAGLGEAALIDAIEQAAHQEAAAGARKSAAIAQLIPDTVDEDGGRGDWAFNSWSNVAAQIGAALGMSSKRASGQMRIAVALRYRLPQVAELFFRGKIRSAPSGQVLPDYGADPPPF